MLSRSDREDKEMGKEGLGLLWTLIEDA